MDSFCIAWAFCDGISAGILTGNVMNCDVDVKQMTVTFVNLRKIRIFAVGKVVHDQLPLNSPRVGRQQG